LAETRYEGYFSIAKKMCMSLHFYSKFYRPLFSNSTEAKTVSVILSEQSTAKTHSYKHKIKQKFCGRTRVLHLTLSHLNTCLQTSGWLFTKLFFKRFLFCYLFFILFIF